MGFAEYSQHDGLGLAELVRNGEVSPSELAEEAIVRIDRHNPALNAIVHDARDEARRVAKSPAAGGRRPELGEEAPRLGRG